MTYPELKIFPAADKLRIVTERANDIAASNETVGDPMALRPTDQSSGGNAPGPQNDKGLTRRRLLQGALAVSAIGGLNSRASGDAPRDETNPIMRENRRPGTRDWMLAKTEVDPATKYRARGVEGYCSRTSLQRGEKLALHLNTDPPSDVAIDIFRSGYYGGLGGRHVLSLDPVRVTRQPDPPVGPNRIRECRWDVTTELTIPDDWTSGVYLGKLTSQQTGLQSYVVFIVRDDRVADFLFQCSDLTWQAYNRWPSQFALYDDGENIWYCGPGVDVSFDRPYGKYCQILDAPLSTGSGSWFLWEFPMAYWMEGQGYDVTYISNLDTHADAAGLLRARGFLSVGHDEYYSLEMYQNLLAARDAGVSLGFFSGDTCWGRVDPRPSSDQRPHRIFSRVDAFGPKLPGADWAGTERFPYMTPSESRLIGARNVPPVTGGGDWVCTLPEHWIYEGTSMNRGDRIPGLIGWEWMGMPADIGGLEVVATGLTQNGSPPPRGKGTYAATVYPGPKGNFVFNAATCWWADGLAQPPGYVRPKVYTEPLGPDVRVQRITTNILQRMRQSSSA